MGWSGTEDTRYGEQATCLSPRGLLGLLPRNPLSTPFPTPAFPLGP